MSLAQWLTIETKPDSQNMKYLRNVRREEIINLLRKDILCVCVNVILKLIR